MREETIKIYKFEELSKEVQTKVLDKHRDWNVDSPDWHEYIFQSFYHLLEAGGFKNPEIHYSGLWSQGDGASFDAEIDLDYFLNMPEFQVLKPVQEYINATIEKRSCATHYSHERTRIAEIGIDSSVTIQKALDLPIVKLGRFIESRRLQFCEDIYQALEDAYETDTSDEAIIEALELNEMEFEENGRAI